MYTFKNNVSEESRKKLIEHNAKKQYKKQIRTVFGMITYALILLFLFLASTKLTFAEGIHVAFTSDIWTTMLTCLATIVFNILVILAFVGYVLILINTKVIFTLCSSNINEIHFYNDTIKITSNSQYLSVPINSFSENTVFKLQKDKIFNNFLQINSWYLSNEYQEIENETEIQNLFNNYKEIIHTEKNKSQTDYYYKDKIITNFLYEFIYQVCKAYNYYGLTNFDKFTIILSLIDIFTLRLGLWIYILTRAIFFLTACLLFATIEIVNRQPLYKKGSFCFNEDKFAVFNESSSCVLYGDNKEILQMTIFKKFIAIDTLKGHFIVPNDLEQLNLLNNNIVFYNYQKNLFK